MVSENWRRIAERCGAYVNCGAVVKANAYGMGISGVAQSLMDVGAENFFVANCKEGSGLRSFVETSAQIFVLSGYSREFRDFYGRFALIPCICDLVSLQHFLSDFPNSDYALHVETGLNRLALDDEAAASELKKFQAHSPALIMSHLACADDETAPLNELQLNRLKKCAIAELFPGTPLSLAGTDGIFLGRQYRLDCVRPGIGLYCGGFGQSTKDCLTVHADLISVKEIQAGESVGYGQSWIAPRKTRMAALAMGYADGLPRTDQGFKFFADGIACNVRGRVSMDIVNVDVSHLSFIPNTFELVGEHQNLQQLSKDLGEIPNSVLTRFGACMGSRIY